MNDLEFLELLLNKMINNTIVHEDGLVLEIKQLVERVRNLKIHIYSNEHNPPHFHVVSNCKTINAVFDLRTGVFLKGEINGKDERRVEYYHSQVKEKLIEYWNKNNPELEIGN
jgi:hypothetical protein